MKKLFAMLVCVLLLGSVTVPAMAAEEKVIRVGYIGYEDFIAPTADGQVAGYGVEYLNEIAKYAGVTFEYTHGTWSDNLKKLQNREIDLVCTAKLTTERINEYEFSKHPFGNVQGVLYTRMDNQNLYYEDYSALNGKKVAFLQGSLNIDIFTTYAQKHGFTFESVFLDSDQAMEQALLSGEVDAIATEHMTKHDNLKLVCNFDNQPFYLMSYQKNSFMDDIDTAMGEILTENPAYQVELFQKYYGTHKVISDPHFTREETEYVKALLENRRESTGQAALRIAAQIDLNPISYVNKDGELAGVRVDLLRKISEISGIPLEIVPLDANGGTYDYGYFREHGFDLMLIEDNPINRAYETIKESGMRFTLPIDALTKVAVARKGFAQSETGDYAIAYFEGSATLPKLIAGWYPNASLVSCKSIDQCFEAVRDGKADMLIYNQYLAEREMLRPQYADLSVVPRISFSDASMLCPLIFKNGAYKEIGDAAIEPYLNDPLLISVLNKAISSISAETKNEIVIKNTIGTYSEQLSLKDFLYKYDVALTTMAVAVLAVVSLMIALYLNKRKNYLKLASVNEKLEKAVVRADAANVAKSQFLAQMSHEIRTPMNAVIGLTSIAKADVHDAEKVQEYLDKIEGSSKLLLGIINDVLDMSAIEGGKLKLDSAPFNFKQMLTNLTTIFYQQAKMKNIHFEVRMNGVTKETIVGDELRVNQILMNLLSNAVKFTPSGGEIDLMVLQASSSLDKVQMRFSVSDTGCGMSEEMLSRLFQPFEQESASTARKHGGSGLGLSIAKNLVEMMGGSIHVKSVVGKGTVFTADIPFGAYETKYFTETTGFSEIRTLVVDDDKESCEYSSILLDRLGVRHDYVTNGEAALEALGEAEDGGDPYKLCLVDWKMPEMDGVEVTQKIREIFGEDTIVIIVSAYDLNEVEASAKAAGANYFITKPLFQSSLFNALMRISGGDYTRIDVEKEKDNFDFSGRRVLVAEDVALNLEVAVKLLQMVGIDVICAEDGKQAVELYEKRKPGTFDCILMDVNMPVMDGYEATKAIRESGQADAQTVPIYAMTANAFSEDVTNALDAGMNGHIAKPIETKVLYKTLEAAFERKDNAQETKARDGNEPL